MYNVGAVTYSQAVTQCQLDGGVLLNQIRFQDKQYVTELTSYRDIDGTIKQAVVWINPAICLVIPDHESCTTCSLYNADNTGKVYKANSCDELHPFICQKLSVVLCENGCFQHGLCVGKTCVCNQGYESDDCSKFHCRDVNDCSGHGKCIGANQCKCRPGWMGRACSISYCARFKACSFCSRQKGCGWCDEKKKCLPGTGYGPDGTLGFPCKSWFYYQCLTMEGSSTCSDQIPVVPCASRYCNKNATESNFGLCQQCQDVQNCYDTSSSCHTWNETKCPNGKSSPDYEDPSRIEATQFKSDVHVIHDNKTIYYCPYSVSSDNMDNLYIYAGEDLETGKIILSKQCGGVMHRIKSVTNINDLQFIVASPVGLKEIIRYADFKQTVDPDALQDEITIEDAPEAELVSQILKSQDNLTEKVHQIDGTVYKCVGHEYSYGESEATTTYYIAMTKNSFTDAVSVGDIVASAKSVGFLEDVISQNLTDIGTVVHTRLSQCDSASVSKKTFNMVTRKPEMSCQGGDNWPGLLYWNSTIAEDVKDKTIVGRRSGPILGKVMNKHEAQGLTFFELIPVSSLADGDLYLKGNVSHVQQHFRIRRSVGSFFHKIGHSLEVFCSGSNYFILSFKFQEDVYYINMFKCFLQDWNSKSIS